MIADKEVLVSGIQYEGSTRIDPRPAKTKYFKVYQAGFKISHYGARYWLLADITQAVPSDLWAVVECDNPIESGKPFVEEGLVKTSAKSFFYDGSGPILGLKMSRKYQIRVTLYDSKNKKKILDQLTQQIKSYVDTTGDTVLMAKGMTRMS